MYASVVRKVKSDLVPGEFRLCRVSVQVDTMTLENFF
jgi:hypothetical protein